MKICNAPIICTAEAAKLLSRKITGNERGGSETRSLGLHCFSISRILRIDKVVVIGTLIYAFVSFSHRYESAPDFSDSHGQ
jgi:hypothetical protein